METKTAVFDGESTSATERISDVAAAAKQKAYEAGRQATDQVDAKRGPAADALENAASTVHKTAENLPGGETVRSVAHSTAEKLESTAGYIREHDVKAMFSDVEDVVRRNPGPSLLIAAALGFLIGRAFREEY
jgi:ElaB/YqjD/DUF883 family membrane-anchored ribosome-binding protein